MQPGTERDGPTSFESEVRSQLERILAHGIFTRSERLSAFPRFITEQTLAGQSASLKEQVLGSCLYAKGAEFDGAADPIVRVDARRLRDKLREYYAEFPLDPILISLPKGRYVPVLEENSPRVPPVAAPSSLEQVIPVRRGSKWLLLVGVAAGTVRITYHGGIYSQESPDGKYLYYADRPRDGNAATTKLMRVPVGGGPEIALQDRLTTFWWRVARSGIYFIRREADFDAIDRYEYGDGRVVRVGRLSGRAGPIGSKMTVSPDERWALVPQENRRSDLMLLDNFR